MSYLSFIHKTLYYWISFDCEPSSTSHSSPAGVRDVLLLLLTFYTSRWKVKICHLLDRSWRRLRAKLQHVHSMSIVWCVMCDVWFWCVSQEQYQYLYKAMLSLISTKENGSSPVSLDRNGSVATSDESDPAESMESLVWRGTYSNFVKLQGLRQTFSEAFFARTLG